MSRHYFLCYILISCKTYCRKDSSSSRGGEGKLNNINCCVNNVTTEKSHIEDCLQVGMPTVVELQVRLQNEKFTKEIGTLKKS